MLQSNLLTLIMASLLAFTSGYFLGVKKGKSERFVDVAELRIEESVVPGDATVDTPSPAPSPSEIVESAAQNDEAPVEAPANTTHPFEARLANAPIILTDTKDRTIEVAILVVSDTAMKVRRQVDSIVVDIPLTMLSPEDQEFAAYLQETGQFAKQAQVPATNVNSGKVEVDDDIGPETRKILEGLFGGFE